MGKDTVYMQAYSTADGVSTCFYEPLGTVTDMVYRYTSEQANFKMFKYCCEGLQIVEHVIKVLSERPSSRFPFLIPDRCYFISSSLM